MKKVDWSQSFTMREKDVIALPDGTTIRFIGTGEWFIDYQEPAGPGPDDELTTLNFEFEISGKKKTNHVSLMNRLLKPVTRDVEGYEMKFSALTRDSALTFEVYAPRAT
ncbi:MAG: hypothetical protein V4760_00090 [Bdellovibrionota bacterium]